VNADRERLLRAVLHDLRTPLNVVQSALGEIEAPPGDPFGDLATRSTADCVFILRFVQGALDGLSRDGTEFLDAAQLEAEVADRLGQPDAVRVRRNGLTRLEGQKSSWSLVLSALWLLGPNEPLDCTLEAPREVRIERASSWRGLGSGDPAAFTSLRPGYAAWVLAAVLERENLRLSNTEDSTMIRLGAAV